MHFDTALNVAWLLLGIVALTSTLCASTVGSLGGQRRRTHALKLRQMPKWLQLVGVASIVIALFPYISASDDLVRIENARPRTQQQGSAPHSPASDLLRLYEVTEAPLVGHICNFAVTFVFLCLIVVPEKSALGRTVPESSGRGPPSASLALTLRP